MKNSTPKKPFIFSPAQPAAIAKCRQRYLIDNQKFLYTMKTNSRVARVIDSLGGDSFDSVSTDRTWEHVIADVLRHKVRGMEVAEDEGHSNAIGFDVFDASPGGMHYAEVKDYGVSLGSGSIKACPKTDNKFCTLVVTVVDENLDAGYAIYAIPPQAIPSDTSSSIDIPHHNGKYMIPNDPSSGCIATTRDELGGDSFSQYRINDLSELYTNSDIFKNFNMKVLASCIRFLHSDTANNGQKDLIPTLVGLFERCVAEGTKGWGSSVNSTLTKPVKEWNHRMYDINDDKTANSRIFFNGKTFDLVAWPSRPKAKETKTAKAVLVAKETKTAKAVLAAKEVKEVCVTKSRKQAGKTLVTKNTAIVTK